MSVQISYTGEKRVMRAVNNYGVHANFEHRYVLPEETRLTWNDAYEWAIENFGKPGVRWDFFFVNAESDGMTDWKDTFGFRDRGDATLFILRWT